MKEVLTISMFDRGIIFINLEGDEHNSIKLFTYSGGFELMAKIAKEFLYARESNSKEAGVNK